MVLHKVSTACVSRWDNEASQDLRRPLRGNLNPSADADGTDIVEHKSQYRLRQQVG